MATPIISEREIRIFMMDKPELNPLLQGVRFSSEDIDQAIINVVDYYNVMIPQTGRNYTVENFPSRWLLLTGVSGHLLRGASINEASNQLTYSVEGVQVNDKDKAQIFAELGTALWNEFKQMAKDLKIAENVNQLYGCLGSEYLRR